MFEKIKKIFKKKTKPVVETKRTYEKIKDHATDISYENEILNKFLIFSNIIYLVKYQELPLRFLVSQVDQLI